MLVDSFVPGSSLGHRGDAVAALVSIVKGNALLKGVAK